MKIVKAIGMCALVLALVVPAAAQDKMITIGISQIVEHPALDAARQGFIDALAKHGYVEGKNVTYDIQIAQGNMATANSIAKALVGKKVDLIHSIATPTSQACVNATKEIPIIISSVTDPVGAGLVESLERPGGNVTGTTDRSPVDRQVDLILEIVPNLKKLGFIYNSGEDNSISSLNQLKEECAKRGIEVVEATVSNSSGVFMAAKSLVGRVDAIHIPTDNTVVSAFESVVKVCEDNKIPLFAADIDSVPRGAIAALAIDYYRLGLQSGEMAVRVLQGADPATMPVETLKDLKLYVNTQAAEKMGVKLPEAVVKRADKVL
ncbi:MAG: ABC transporter substrate-binding protein [Desulfacinum sp.]|jgi:putative ABC transport system substrate-binding protein|nr:ABC transporter substrate-binding protein [Desulfacinum sp.]